MPKPIPPNIEGSKAAITALSAVPTSFTIQGISAGWLNIVIGNSWVPKVMPDGHNAHLALFTLAQNNFQGGQQNNAHFVNVMTAVSATNFDLDFDGKGLIVGLMNQTCQNLPAAPYSVWGSSAETWTINPPIVDLKVWEGKSVAPVNLRHDEPRDQLQVSEWSKSSAGVRVLALHRWTKSARLSIACSEQFQCVVPLGQCGYGVAGGSHAEYGTG